MCDGDAARPDLAWSTVVDSGFMRPGACGDAASDGSSAGAPHGAIALLHFRVDEYDSCLLARRWHGRWIDQVPAIPADSV